MSIQVAKRPSLSARFEALEAEATELKGKLFVAERNLELAQSEVSRLRVQLTDIPDLREQVAKLTKERDDSKNSSKWSDDRARTAESELEQAHAVLDGVSGAPAREYEQEYGKGKRNVVTRLAGAFLAIAQKGV